jgi:hypothetical protein
MFLSAGRGFIESWDKWLLLQMKILYEVFRPIVKGIVRHPPGKKKTTMQILKK